MSRSVGRNLVVDGYAPVIKGHLEQLEANPKAVDFVNMARLLRSKLTDDELLQLHTLMDEDANFQLDHAIVVELVIVKPELFPTEEEADKLDRSSRGG